jgi:hypothetical protein
MLNVIMLSVTNNNFMPSVVMLSVIKLSVVAPLLSLLIRQNNGRISTIKLFFINSQLTVIS